MRFESTSGVRRYRYGPVALWSLCDDLVGTAARRFAGRVDVHFRDGGTSLLVDLRGAGFIDSAGAGALTRCRVDHPGFVAVGRPMGWLDLPGSVRRALGALQPLPDLESALAAAGASQEAREPRLHSRVPLQIPVELFLDGRTAPVTLRDIGRGGALFDLVPSEWLAALWETKPEPTFTVLGLETDPFGREITTGSPRALSAVAVRRYAGQGLGVRFLSHDPPA